MSEWIPVFSFQWRQPFPFCLLFSSASKHNDEMKSVASVQVTGLQQATQFAYIAPATLTSFGQVLLIFLFCVSTLPGSSFSSHRTKGESNLVAAVSDHKGNMRYFTHNGWLHTSLFSHFFFLFTA